MNKQNQMNKKSTSKTIPQGGDSDRTNGITRPDLSQAVAHRRRGGGRRGGRRSESLGSHPLEGSLSSEKAHPVARK